MSEDLPSLIVVRPATIADAQVTASNVPEVPPAAYNSGTTYALNALATVFSGTDATTADIYLSLAGGNTNHAPASSPAWWRWFGSTYAEFVFGGPIGAGYAASARVIDAASHQVFESLINGNNSDLVEGPAWALVGPTNKFAMFDTSNSTQSEVGRQITTTIAPAGRIDSIGLFNLDAATVRIQIAAAGYDETYDLAETSGITDWYAWFFEPVLRRDLLIVTDIPAYLNPSIAITIDNGSAVARAGSLIAGQSLDLGLSLAGAESGLVSYSKIDVNEWGDYSLTRRKSAKKVPLKGVIDYDDVDRARRVLADLDAVPTVWRGTDRFAALAVFGIYRSFSIVFNESVEADFSVDLEGLT